MPVQSKLLHSERQLFFQQCQLNQTIRLHESRRVDLPQEACVHCTPWSDKAGSLEYVLEASRRKKAACRWVVDSGATVHCINDPSMFECIYSDHPQVNIVVADGKKVKMDAVGSVRVHFTDEQGKLHDFLLHNVVCSRHFSHNLLSVRRMYKEHQAEFTFGRSNYFTNCWFLFIRNFRHIRNLNKVKIP